MQRRGLWFLILVLLSTTLQAVQPITYKINGLDNALKKNASLYLQALPAIKPKQFKGYEQDIREALAKSLKPLGYYQPTIHLRFDKKVPNRLLVNIKRGPAVVIRSLQVRVEGDAQQDSAFQQLLQKQPLKEGNVLNDGLYEQVKAALSDLAQMRGYFDADFTDHTIKVHLASHEADVSLVLKSGKRYRFGAIEFSPRVSAATQKLLTTMINFQPNEYYLGSKISQLNLSFSSVGYFKSIEVRPLKDKAFNSTVPIFINVSPKTAWDFETGIGFSTDEGARLSLSAKKPRMGERGDSFSSSIKLSKRKSGVNGRYKIPQGNPLLKYYSLDFGYLNSVVKDTDSNLFYVSVNNWKKRPGNWDQNFFIRADYESYTLGLLNTSSLLLIPGVAFDRRIVRGDPINPHSGTLLNFKIETSAKAWQSDANFIKVWGRAKGLTRFFGRNRLIGRFEQGGIWIDNFKELPPSIRFFSGGDQTVRGYSYESIAPRSSNGTLVGGKYLTVASLEYDFELFENWRLALFVDHGTVTNNYRRNKVDWKTGIGPGIRWVTPLGPLKLDVAFAISEPGSPWRLSFSMGPDL